MQINLTKEENQIERRVKRAVSELVELGCFSTALTLAGFL